MVVNRDIHTIMLYIVQQKDIPSIESSLQQTFHSLIFIGPYTGARVGKRTMLVVLLLHIGPRQVPSTNGSTSHGRMMRLDIQEEVKLELMLFLIEKSQQRSSWALSQVVIFLVNLQHAVEASGQIWCRASVCLRGR